MINIRLIWLAIFSTALAACGDRTPRAPETLPAPNTAQQTNTDSPQPQAPAVPKTRDVAAADVPAAVSAALSRARPNLKVAGIVEKDEGGGLLIYAFTGTDADGKDSTVEVKYDGRMAAVLIPDGN